MWNVLFKKHRRVVITNNLAWIREHKLCVKGLWEQEGHWHLLTCKSAPLKRDPCHPLLFLFFFLLLKATFIPICISAVFKKSGTSKVITPNSITLMCWKLDLPWSESSYCVLCGRWKEIFHHWKKLMSVYSCICIFKDDKKSCVLPVELGALLLK